MRQIEKLKLNELGYELIELKQSPNVYTEISSHVDIFTCKVGNTLIIEPSQYNYIKIQLKEKAKTKQTIEEVEKEEQEKMKILKGEEEVEIKYPFDIKYNVCTMEKKAFHNFKFTDLKVKEELIKQGYELINTTQGYTNCSIAVIDEKSAIVTDKGLYKILKKHNIDVLYLEDELDIKLLDIDKYSNRKGFIGGAISRVGENVVVFGDLYKIDINDKIRKFIHEKELNIIEFKELDVIDYGGIVELQNFLNMSNM